MSWILRVGGWSPSILDRAIFDKQNFAPLNFVSRALTAVDVGTGVDSDSNVISFDFFSIFNSLNLHTPGVGRGSDVNEKERIV
jgi:hypothetical protein